MDWTRDGFGALDDSMIRVGLGCRNLLQEPRVSGCGLNSGFLYLWASTSAGSVSDDSVSPPNPTPTASSAVALATPDCHLSRHKCAHSGCSFVRTMHDLGGLCCKQCHFIQARMSHSIEGDSNSLDKVSGRLHMQAWSIARLTRISISESSEFQVHRAI